MATLGIVAASAQELPPVPAPGEPPSTDQPTDTTTPSESGSASNGSVELRTTIGADGLIDPGQPVPLRVTVSAKRLITGYLQFTSDTRGGFSEDIRVDVEIPGGSTKSFTAVLASNTWEDTTYDIALVVDDEPLAEMSVVGAYRSDIESVGVFPSLASARELPDQTALAVEGTGGARLIPVQVDFLRAGPDALAVFDMLALNRQDLASLASTEAQTLQTWIVRGGRLLVDEQTAPLPALPDAWQPENNDWATAGRGAVVLTKQELAAGNWSSVLQPTAPTSFRAAQNPFGGGSEGQRFSEQRIDQSLSYEAGFELPSVRWLVLLLAAYVLVVGPLGYFLLRRLDRPLLFWLLVPAGSLAFTGLLYVTGSSLRESNQSAHATYLEVHDGGANATTHVLVNSRSGGDEGIIIPVGWTGATPQNARSDYSVSIRNDAVEAVTELGPGQFGLLSARGTLDEYADAIVVEAIGSDDGQITGTITNNLEVTLQAVTVFAQTQATLIGEIGAGETADFAIDNLTQNIFDEGGAEWNVWQRFISLDQRGDGPLLNSRTGEVEVPAVNMSLWDDYTSRTGPEARPPGEVTVVGWSDAIDAPATTIRGKIIDSGRTAVIRQQAVAGDGLLNRQSIVRRTVRGSEQARFEAVDREGALSDFGGGFEDFTGVLQFRLPTPDGDKVDTDRLVIEAGRGYQVIQVWDHTEQRWLSATDKALLEGLVAVPKTAILGGAINVRFAITQEEFFNRFEQGVLSLRQLDEDTELPPSPVYLEPKAVEAVG